MLSPSMLQRTTISNSDEDNDIDDMERLPFDSGSKIGSSSAVEDQRIIDTFDVKTVTLRDILDARLDAAESRRLAARRRKRGPAPPTSAQTFFRFDELEVVATEHPEYSAEQVLSIVAQNWDKISDERKMMYEQMAARDHERYNEERRHYLPRSVGGHMKRAKKRKHPDAPKHPRSAYLFYVAEYRQQVKKEFPDKKFAEIARELGQRWSKLSDEEKKVYIDEANADKERYRLEKEAFEVPQPDLYAEEKQREKEAAERRKKKNFLTPRHPLSAYLFFVATNRSRMNEQYPSKSFTETARLLGLIWRQLDDTERRKYELLSVADKYRYEEEKQTWEPPTFLLGPDRQMDAKPIDPVEDNKSRKPTSAYAIWAAQERAAVLRYHPDIDRKELTKILRQSWKELTPHEKMPFLEQEKKDKMQSSQEAPAQASHSFEKVQRNLPQQVQDSHPLRSPPPLEIPSMDATLDFVGLESQFMQLDEAQPPNFSPSSDNETVAEIFTSNSQIREWNADDVGRFIESLGLSHLSGTFVQSRISGSEFVQLTTLDLKNTFHLTNLGERKKIRAAIDQRLAQERS